MVQVPSWSKDGTVKMHTINARAESLTTNNLWRGVVKRKRCIILVNGYSTNSFFTFILSFYLNRFCIL